jgi:hypothetical protein
MLFNFMVSSLVFQCLQWANVGMSDSCDADICRDGVIDIVPRLRIRIPERVEGDYPHRGSSLTFHAPDCL